MPASLSRIIIILKGPDCLLVISANILLAPRVTKSDLNAPHDRKQVVTEIQNQ